MKDFLLQPESNNSVTVWFRGRSVKIYHDHARLIIEYDNEELRPVVDDISVRFERVQKVAIEEVLGSADFGGSVDYRRFGDDE